MKKILIATFALSIMFGACKKEDVMKVTPQDEIKGVAGNTKDSSGNAQNGSGERIKPVYQPYTVVNGRPVFATVADFKWLMTATKTKSLQELLSVWGITCGYNTLLSRIEGISKNVPTLSKMAMRGIEDQSFAAILNDKGEIQLGDTIAKVIGDEEYIYHVSNALAVETAVINAQASGTLETVGSQIATIPGIRVRTTIVNLLPSTNGGTRVACPPFTNVFTNTQNFNGSERSYFKFANRSYLFYATLNVVVDTERRLGGFWGTLFGWGHTNVPSTKEWIYSVQYRQNIAVWQTCYAQASGHGFVTRDPITQLLPTPINEVWANNTQVLRRNLDWSVGMAVWFNITQLDATLNNTYNGVNHNVRFQPCGQGCL